MRVPRVKRRQRLTAKILNKIIDQANAGGNLTVGKGLIRRTLPGGALIARDPVTELLQEAAHEVLVVNADTVDIPALTPAGIVDSVATDDIDLMNHRTIRVRLPLAEDAGRMVIVQNRIKPGMAGLAWISGVCLVKLMRWFHAEVLQSAEIYAGESYAVATHGGSLDILWEQRDEEGDLILDEEHLAVVRFNHRQFALWQNEGTTTVPWGGALVVPSTETNGLAAGDTFGALALRAPTGTDSVLFSYANVGGPVLAGEYGRCTSDEAMIRTKAEYNVRSRLGPEISQTTFSNSGFGWQVMANLGEAADDLTYAVVRASPLPAAMILTITGGNTLADAVTLGIKKVSTISSVPSAYDPNVDTTFIDGIGRGTLELDGVAQSGFVLIVNDGRLASPVTFALFATGRVACFAVSSILISGSATGASVTVYVPYFR